MPAADPRPGEVAAPVPLAIPALAPTRRAQGKDDALILTGWWFRALGQPDAPMHHTTRRPLVIGLHGCGGAYGVGGPQQGRLGAIWRQDAVWFGAEGIDLLVLDSFGPRQLHAICDIPVAARPVNERDRAADLADTLRWIAGLATHPAQMDLRFESLDQGRGLVMPSWDVQRIVVLGRSHGAQSVLAALHPEHPAMQALPIHVQAAIALYPGCRSQADDPAFQPSRPLLLLVGALDDWTNPQPCARLAHKHPQRIRFIQYEGAYHAFDAATPVRQRGQVASTRSGTATVGGHPPSREAAHRQIFDWLQHHGLGPLQLAPEQRYALPPWPASSYQRGS